MPGGDPYSVSWAPGRPAVITLPAVIKAANVGRVYVAVGRALETGAVVIVADMTGTLSCSYAGVQALVSAHIAATAAGMALRVAAAAPAVRRMLRLAGADRELDLYPDLDSALAGPRAAANTDGSTASRRALRLIPGGAAFRSPGRRLPRLSVVRPPGQPRPAGPPSAPG